MAQVDFQHREIAIKLVYYGPALSGKTTNLQQIHARMDPKRRGRLLTLDTKEDRTLYFDLLPLAFKSASGVTCKVKLFTVPGQVHAQHHAQGGAAGVRRRRLHRRLADRRDQEQQRVVRQPEGEHEGEPARSERDPDRHPVQQARPARACAPTTISSASPRAARSRSSRRRAIEGKGVPETFLGLAAATWEVLEKKIGLGSQARHPQAGAPRRAGAAARRAGAAARAAARRSEREASGRR